MAQYYYLYKADDDHAEILYWSGGLKLLLMMCSGASASGG